MVIARMRKMRKEAEKRNSLCFWSVYTKNRDYFVINMCEIWGGVI